MWLRTCSRRGTIKGAILVLLTLVALTAFIQVMKTHFEIIIISNADSATQLIAQRQIQNGTQGSSQKDHFYNTLVKADEAPNKDPDGKLNDNNGGDKKDLNGIKENGASENVFSAITSPDSQNRKDSNGEIRTISDGHQQENLAENPNISKMSINIDAQNDSVLQDILKTMDLPVSVLEMLTRPVINEYNYKTIIQPTNPCQDSSPEVFFMVPSGVGNFARREKLRNSVLSKYVQLSQNKAKMLFFVGSPSDDEAGKKIQHNLYLEAQAKKDIVQDSFLDIYKHIRLKSMSMLKWTSEHCGHVPLIIRHDDDVRIRDLTTSVNVLRNHSTKHANFILGDFCLANHWPPVRIRENKYYISEEEFPDKFFPPFTRGGFIGFPIATVKLLYEASLRVKAIWLDDVYVTGILADSIKARKISDHAFLFQHLNLKSS